MPVSVYNEIWRGIATIVRSKVYMREFRNEHRENIMEILSGNSNINEGIEYNDLEGNDGQILEDTPMEDDDNMMDNEKRLYQTGLMYGNNIMAYKEEANLDIDKSTTIWTVKIVILLLALIFVMAGIKNWFHTQIAAEILLICILCLLSITLYGH